MLRRRFEPIVRALRRLRGDTAGGIGVLATAALPVMLGAAGLAYDLNRGLAQRVAAQRAADMAALGAAMAYKANPDPTILTPTARDVATANGMSGATVTAALVANYPNSGDQSVRVTVSSQLPYTLARVLGLPASYTVTSEAYARLVTQVAYATPCLLGLAGSGTAISTSGGASINASTCSVAAVGTVANGGASITAHDVISGAANITNDYGSISATSLRYAGSFINPAWNTAVPAASARVNQATTLADPLASNADLIQARTLLGTYAAVPTLTNPSTPSSGAQDWAFNYTPTAPVAAYRTGPYTSAYVVPVGSYTIRSLTVAGGISVTFTSGSTITIANGFANAGASVNFGNSNVYVNGGFDSGSSGVTIGDGVLWIGSGTVTFHGANRKGNGNVTINATLNMGGGQTLTIGNGQHSFGGFNLQGGAYAVMGTGDFVAVNGVVIGGGSELAMGDGAITIGASGGTAINLAGSARMFMGDGAFSANGSIVTAGGSLLAFGKTANHLINGGMNIAGAALFGAGRYTVAGGFANGTGGAVWPYTDALTGKTWGQTLEGVSVAGYGMVGVNVTFVLGGTLNLGGGVSTKLIAPTATTSGGAIADILLASQTSAATSWGGGATNLFSGILYLPNSAITMSGGNATVGTGQCFSLIANTIALTGGATAATACPSMAGSGGASGSNGAIRLVK